MIRYTTVFALMMVLSMGSLAPVQAAPPENAGEIIRHLEFLGYKVSRDEKRIRATHARRLNLVIRKYRGGMLVSSFFGASARGKANKDQFLAVVNQLNRDAAASRFYIDKDGDLTIEGYFPGEYSKRAFSTFLDTYDLALAQIAKNRETLQAFLE